MSYNGYHRNEWGVISANETGLGADTLGCIVGLILFAAVFVVLFAGIYAFSQYSCNENAKKMGFECDYSLITGCKIKLENGHYVDIDNYRGGF